MNTYTPEEQAEHRQVFVDALESGRYKQCTGLLTKLVDPDKGHPYEEHCCLGVATEEAMIAGVVLRRVPYEPDKLVADYRWINERLNEQFQVDLLPEPVRHWLGFATTDGQLREAVLLDESDPERSGRASSLVDLNDDLNFTFEDIAQQIRNDNIVLEGEPTND